jgi:glycosyltransferase involved in cell wall biosynthesis
MFLGVSTLTESGRSYQDMDDQIEVRFLQHALHAVHQLDQGLRVLVFTDPSTHEAFYGFERVCIEGGRSQLLGGRGALVAQAVREAGVNTILAPMSCPLPPHQSFMQTLFLTDFHFMGSGDGRETPSAERLTRQARKALRASAGLLCTSHTLQKSCIARFGLGLERIFVAPPGVSDVFQEDRPPITARPYSLLPVNRYTLPSLPALREAMKRRPELFPPTLVVIGQIQLPELEEFPCGIIRVECCPDAVLASLLRHADLLLYPAVDDGCGVAVLEALRAGAPILTTRTGAPAEWGGAVPAYCDPQNVISIIQALRRFHDETPSEREDRLAMGRGAASEATWERCAWKFLAALKHT